MKIYNRWDGSKVIFKSNGKTLRATVLAAVPTGAVLYDAVLSGAPIIPNIHQAVYAAASATEGALEMGSSHECDTTHCRAGWVVTLAGEAGRKLEKKIGTAEAATLIYLASDPNIERIPDFYCDNETAMADMKRLAEEEAAKSF